MSARARIHRLLHEAQALRARQAEDAETITAVIVEIPVEGRGPDPAERLVLPARGRCPAIYEKEVAW